MYEISIIQVKKEFCYQKLFWHFTVWINCSSDLKTFENSWPSASNLKFFSWLLEHFFFTICKKSFGKTKYHFSFRSKGGEGWPTDQAQHPPQLLRKRPKKQGRPLSYLPSLFSLYVVMHYEYYLMLMNYLHSKLSEHPLKMGVLGSPFGPWSGWPFRISSSPSIPASIFSSIASCHRPSEEYLLSTWKRQNIYFELRKRLHIKKSRPNSN